MTVRLGSKTYERPLFMAPMEGITDVPFRRVVRKFGCHVVCTQMIHAEALLRHDIASQRLRDVATLVEEERPVGLQLCGPSPPIVAEAAKKAVDMGAAFIDINMGCPAKNVVKIGAGAALLKEPERAAAIVSAVSSAVTVPVTVKIRAGWDEHYRNGPDFAKGLESAGAKLISVHARTKAQKHNGKADWNLISLVKERVRVPVVGNGGVDQPEDIDRMFTESGADGVMAARGALGNPWLFERRRPTIREVRETMLAHFDHHLSFYDHMSNALITFRKHLVWYTQGLANAAEFRKNLFKEKSLDVMLEMIDRFFDALDPDEVRSIEYVD